VLRIVGPLRASGIDLDIVHDVGPVIAHRSAPPGRRGEQALEARPVAPVGTQRSTCC